MSHVGGRVLFEYYVISAVCLWPSLMHVFGFPVGGTYLDYRDGDSRFSHLVHESPRLIELGSFPVETGVASI